MNTVIVTVTENQDGVCPECNCAIGLHTEDGCLCEGNIKYYPNLEDFKFHFETDVDWVECICNLTYSQLGGEKED
jgi:hypothetical protein